MTQHRTFSLTSPRTAELREKGSRFLAVVAPANDEAEARSRLAQCRAEHGSATHVCFAWRLLSESQVMERMSDDGEPSGTAGAPMLRVLQGRGLCNVVATVVRYYGGTKLGKGGLARAYGGAVRLALEEAVAIELRAQSSRFLDLTYTQWGAVQRLVQPPRVALGDVSYGERIAVELLVDADYLATLDERLSDLGLRLRESK